MDANRKTRVRNARAGKVPMALAAGEPPCDDPGEAAQGGGASTTGAPAQGWVPERPLPDPREVGFYAFHQAICLDSLDRSRSAIADAEHLQEVLFEVSDKAEEALRHVAFAFGSHEESWPLLHALREVMFGDTAMGRMCSFLDDHGAMLRRGLADRA